jgi:hypothetical protein
MSALSALSTPPPAPASSSSSRMTDSSTTSSLQEEWNSKLIHARKTEIWMQECHSGTVIKLIQSIIELVTFECFSNRQPEDMTIATQENHQLRIYQKICLQFVEKRGYFEDEGFQRFFKEYIEPHLLANDCESVSLIALLSQSYLKKGKVVNERTGASIRLGGLEVRKDVRNKYIPKFEAKLVDGKPPSGKTLADIFEAVRYDCYLDEKKIVRDENGLFEPPEGFINMSPLYVPCNSWLAFGAFGPLGHTDFGIGSLGIMASDGAVEDSIGLSRALFRKKNDKPPGKRARCRIS